MKINLIAMISQNLDLLKFVKEISTYHKQQPEQHNLYKAMKISKVHTMYKKIKVRGFLINYNDTQKQDKHHQNNI